MAGHQIGLLTETLTGEDSGNYLLTIILRLANDPDDETGRIVACKVPQKIYIFTFNSCYQSWPQHLGRNFVRHE